MSSGDKVRAPSKGRVNKNNSLMSFAMDKIQKIPVCKDNSQISNTQC